MMRQRDPFWEYAEDFKGRFVCKFCQKNYPGGIARVKSHLSKLPGRDVAMCTKVPHDVHTLALDDIRSKEEYPYKRRRGLSSFTYIEENGVKIPVSPLTVSPLRPTSPTTSCPDSPPRLHQATSLAVSSTQRLHQATPLITPRFHQATPLAVSSKQDEEAVDKMVKDEKPVIKMIKDKESVDKMVAQAFMMNGININVVQSPSFISMIKAIAEYGSGYSLPSCATLSTKLLRDARTEVSEYVSAIKASWSLTGCTLMSDIWTDAKSCSFFSLIAYSPKGAVFLKSYDRADSVGDDPEDILLSTIDEIGSENVVQVIVNRVSYEEYGMDLVAERYPQIYRTKCASDGIQLLLEDIYKKVEWIQLAFDDAKLIVDYLCKYPLVLKSMQFTSRIVASPEWSSMNESKTSKANNIVQMIQSLDFWSQGKEVISALEPLISVLRLVEGEGSTAGYLYEALERVRVELKQRRSADASKYSKLLKLFDSRREGDIIHKIHAAAAFLNPSLMYDGKIKYEQPDIRDGMNYVVEHMMMVSYRDLEMQDKHAINLEKLGEHPEDINGSRRKSESIIHINGDTLKLNEVVDLVSSP
ncbi:hypothetical protein IFM89_026251 [Coptis chinensis]|uniref:BED-type domain-containing protein n=1 Tax=Coptis chinensis TaxID=261450 RepID=A0A835I5D9_9MAGN|nr:hypothetical protein IFM89_026251 [Coptis chinensis]